MRSRLRPRRLPWRTLSSITAGHSPAPKTRWMTLGRGQSKYGERVCDVRHFSVRPAVIPGTAESHAKESGVRYVRHGFASAAARARSAHRALHGDLAPQPPVLN